MSYYLHDVPGRLRIKSPSIKRNENVAREVKKALATLNGIGTVDINLTTGSLLVNYNPRSIASREILSLLTRRGYFNPAQAVNNDDYVREAVTKASNVFTRALTGSFVDVALEGTGLSILGVLI